MMRIFVSVVLMTLLIVLGWSLLTSQEVPPADEPEPPAAGDEVSEKIVPGPQDIKEAAGIVVFLAWIWLSVLVLTYFLVQKIKEADRLHRLKFFPPKKE